MQGVCVGLLFALLWVSYVANPAKRSNLSFLQPMNRCTSTNYSANLSDECENGDNGEEVDEEGNTDVSEGGAIAGGAAAAAGASENSEEPATPPRRRARRSESSTEWEDIGDALTIMKCIFTKAGVLDNTKKWTEEGLMEFFEQEFEMGERDKKILSVELERCLDHPASKRTSEYAMLTTIQCIGLAVQKACGVWSPAPHFFYD